MSIPLIHVDDLGSVQIQNVTVPNYHVHEPNVNHLIPPVVLNIGNPIIDMPGHMMGELNKRTLKNFVKYEGLKAHSWRAK